jgi:hypothetical protein
MHALLYESRAEPRLTDTELEIVLIGSRVRNARRAITGVLLKQDDRIVQYLEGDADAVSRTFEAISASPLHREVTVLARGDGARRVFDRWHMGFFELHSLAARDRATEAWGQARPDAGDVAADSPLARLLQRSDELEAAGRAGPRSGA